MLVIRYLRVGRKNQPSFRIVVTDKRKAPRGGRFVEILGFYNPLTKKKNVKKDRVLYWISKGAQPSVSIHNLLVSEKIIEGKKIAIQAKKKSKDGNVAQPVIESVKKREIKTPENAEPKKEAVKTEKPEEKNVEIPTSSPAPQTPALAPGEEGKKTAEENKQKPKNASA